MKMDVVAADGEDYNDEQDIVGMWRLEHVMGGFVAKIPWDVGILHACTT